MEETVVGRWSKDISKMESEAAQRWKSNIKALRNAFNSFDAKFNSEVRDMEGDAAALKNAFEEFANEFSKDVERMFSHIWGTEADKEAWEKKHGR